MMVYAMIFNALDAPRIDQPRFAVDQKFLCPYVIGLGWLSLAGSRFSSDSAPGPFHHGIRRRGGTICLTTLPSE